MVLELQVNGSLSRGEDNLLDGLAARNLVNLRNVLTKRSEGRLQVMRSEYIPDERICLRRLDPVRDGERAIQEYGLHGKSGTSPRLGDT